MTQSTTAAIPTIDALIAIVRDDQTASDLRWRAAIESDGDEKWAEYAADCTDAYDDAIGALEAGDLGRAEGALERANLAEIRGGDNCDAHHALRAVRAAASKAQEVR